MTHPKAPETIACYGVSEFLHWAVKTGSLGQFPVIANTLYPLVTLAAQQLFSTGQIYRRCAAWYLKPQATFSDTIAGVRRALWSHAYFSISNKEVDMVKIRRPLVDRFIDSLCYAA